MGKIYDANGAKMNVAGICAEVLEIVTPEQKSALAANLAKYDFANDHMKLAHAILDTYKSIDSATEQGARLRKLLDNIMTKYQKSTVANTDDMSQYRFLITELTK